MVERAAIYVRIATIKQGDREPILEQRKMVEVFCAERGWHVAKVFVDAPASGMDEQRPAFQEMITEATSKDRSFDVLVVRDFRRLSRDVAQLVKYTKCLEGNGVRIVSIT